MSSRLEDDSAADPEDQWRDAWSAHPIHESLSGVKKSLQKAAVGTADVHQLDVARVRRLVTYIETRLQNAVPALAPTPVLQAVQKGLDEAQKHLSVANSESGGGR